MMLDCDFLPCSLTSAYGVSNQIAGNFQVLELRTLTLLQNSDKFVHF